MLVRLLANQHVAWPLMWHGFELQEELDPLTLVRLFAIVPIQLEKCYCCSLF